MWQSVSSGAKETEDTSTTRRTRPKSAASHLPALPALLGGAVSLGGVGGGVVATSPAHGVRRGCEVAKIHPGAQTALVHRPDAIPEMQGASSTCSWLGGLTQG